MKEFIIKDKNYTLEEIYEIGINDYCISLSKDVKNKIIKSRQFIESKIKSNDIIYGVNTGFGKLSQIKIKNNNVNQLQRNLILSHAVGTGEYIPDDIVKLIILLKIVSFTKGYSGVRLEIVDALLGLLNAKCLPLIPSKGSVGASGDLAPLSHMSLAILGIGKVKYNNKIINSKAALKKINQSPVELEAKEGLALINGTQFSTAYGVYCLYNFKNLMKIADLSCSMSIEAMQCSKDPFLKYVNDVKPFLGQSDVSINIINILKDSEIMDSHAQCDRVQDMYSVRCVPQVHGSARDLMYFSIKQVNIEINSVSDNPLVFPNEDKVISAGQFHAESIGHSLDIAAISCNSIASISERRVFSLLKGSFGLPEFLIKNPGLNSGFMMLQVTAAALASEIKSLSHPASIDTIPTCSDQEDYVSMAPYAGRKLYEIIENLTAVLSIELLSACQGIDFRNGLKPAKLLNKLYKLVRSNIDFLDKDRLLKNDLDIMIDLIKSGTILKKISRDITII